MADRTEIDEVIARLAAAPAHFAELLSRLEDADSVASSGAGEWSPSEVLAHVRAANDILEPRIFFVLVRDNPPLVGYDDTRWLEVARYKTLPVTDSLQSMRLRRHELVRALQGLAPEEWESTGNHEVRGPMSVLEIARQITEHEDDHLAQLARSIGFYSGQ